MKRSYIIEDKDGECWTGVGWTVDGGIQLAARFSSLEGASQALCMLSPSTERRRFPLRIRRWVSTRQKS